MNSLNGPIEKFTKLHLRERLLILLAAILAVYLIMDIAFLSPQQKKIKELQLLNQAHQTELAAINSTLSELERNPPKNQDQRPLDLAAIGELKKQVAKADAFFRETGATPTQVTSLLKELLDASPGLVLVSLRTLPIAPFYSPENNGGGSDKAGKEPKEEQKIIQKYGAEISVKGNYMALLSYMENLQRHPRRLFWSEARLDVTDYPNTVLKLVVYSLGSQPDSSSR